MHFMLVLLLYWNYHILQFVSRKRREATSIHILPRMYTSRQPDFIAFLEWSDIHLTRGIPVLHPFVCKSIVPRLYVSIDLQVGRKVFPGVHHRGPMESVHGVNRSREDPVLCVVCVTYVRISHVKDDLCVFWFILKMAWWMHLECNDHWVWKHKSCQWYCCFIITCQFYIN